MNNNLGCYQTTSPTFYKISGAIFFIVAHLLTVECYAKDFYWLSNKVPGNFASAVAACLAYQPTNSDQRTFKFHSLEFRSENNASCLDTVFDADGSQAPGGSQPWNRTDHIAYREGETCPPATAYNYNTGECVFSDSSNKGAPEINACGINSVNMLNGNTYIPEKDKAANDSIISFARFYNSLDGIWRHSYSTHLQIRGTSITRVTANGQEFSYSIEGAVPKAVRPELGKLEQNPNGWIYTSANNEVFDFDATGRLLKIVSNTGQPQTLTYNTNVIVVSDQFGHSLAISEDSKHQPLTLAAPGINIQYSYDAGGHLTQVARTQGGETRQRQYHYGDIRNNALLTGITDERGVLEGSWTYDDQGRAISSKHANGAEHTQVTYNEDGSSTVTNALGKQTVYHFTDVGGFKKVSSIEGEPSANCPASNSTFTYNDRGQVLTQTDAKGFVTTYTYNDRGLETTRTQASGTPQARTTTTTWHATFNLPLTVTEAGQVTTYTYDIQGRQTSRTQTAL